MSTPRNFDDAHWNLLEPIAFNHDTNLFDEKVIAKLSPSPSFSLG